MITENSFSIISIVISSLLLISCLNNKEVDSSAIKDIKEFSLTYSKSLDTYLKSNIHVEQKNDSVAEYIYNIDNVVYDFLYSRQYQYFYIKDNDTLFIKLNKKPKDVFNIPSWEFTSTIDSLTIQYVSLQSDIDVLFFGFDYEQTVIKYDYMNSHGDIILPGERTGLIENHKNIWMHPPRYALFKILELNPFFFVKTPYLPDNDYSFELSLDDQWVDERWKTWTGQVETKASYHTEGFELIKYRNTLFSCLKVSAKSTSRLGETYASFWFSSDLGFLRIEYTNIDSSKLHFQLI